MSAIALLAIAALAGPSSADDELADKLLRSALEYKQGIRTGHVVLRMSYSKADESREQTKVRYEIDFDGDQVRSIAEYHGPKGTTTARALMTRRDFLFDEGTPAAAVTGRLTELATDPMTKGRLSDAFQPKLLGMVPEPVPAHAGITLGEAFWFANRRPRSVTRETFGGEDAWKIVYEFENPGREVRLWIAPRFGHGVVCHELEWTRGRAEGRKPSMLRVESRYKQYTDVWFPEVVTYQHLVQGTVQVEQATTVESAEFGAPADPAIFSPGRLGLKPGRMVIGSGRKALTWNGNALVDMQGDLPRKMQDARRSGPLAALLYGNAAVCAVIAFILMRKVLKDRRSNVPGSP